MWQHSPNSHAVRNSPVRTRTPPAARCGAHRPEFFPISTDWSFTEPSSPLRWRSPRPSAYVGRKAFVLDMRRSFSFPSPALFATELPSRCTGFVTRPPIEKPSAKRWSAGQTRFEERNSAELNTVGFVAMLRCHELGRGGVVCTTF